MKDLLLPLLHLAVTAAKLCRPGGVRAVIAENLLLKQQLIVLRRSRQRAPNLRVGDRLLCGFGSAAQCGQPSYARLNRILSAPGFDASVEGQCARFYATMGGPSLAQERYFRLLISWVFGASVIKCW